MNLFTISNFLTLTNLFCGCMGIVFLLTGKSEFIIYFIAIASVCDFFDGFVARMRNTMSDLGKELDSLADMVTFGVVPGLMFFNLLSVYKPSSELGAYVPFLGFILTLAAALRLAKFNVDERQTDSFIGLATPACTLYVLAIFMLFQNGNLLFTEIISDKFFLIPNIIILSYLQISEIKMFSFKLKKKTFKGNRLRLFFLVYSLILWISLGYLGLAISIISYIVLSLFLNFRK